MTATRGAAARLPKDPSSLGIGEVLARLRPDFPDITISKLRFLEAEGLVDPLRTPSGYRKYTTEHLERLRFVLTAQRDRYLPLRVIREQLAAHERGERAVGLAPATGSERVGSRATAGGGRAEWNGGRLTRAQLCERSGLDEAGLADLEQFGLLAPASNGDFAGEALTIARIAARLADYGLQARHLRPYRTTADREVGLLAQLVPPVQHRTDSHGRQEALETVHELAALCAQLHGALVRQGLRDVLGA